MSTISDLDLLGYRQAQPEHLQCPKCGTGRYLGIHSIDSLRPPAQGLVAVPYTCEACADVNTDAASVPQIAGILNRLGLSAADILQFGGQYSHCGESRHSADTQLRCACAPVATQAPAIDVLEVYLSTHILRCGCGFQMEIPC
jgi:hypothetical protein